MLFVLALMPTALALTWGPWAMNTTIPIHGTWLPTPSGTCSSSLPQYTSRPRVTISVGGTGQEFRPSSVTAARGTILQFDFLSLNHTLTQSDLFDPCYTNGGFDSGFHQFNPGNISGRYIVEYKVTDRFPRWFFCSQTAHCQSGMVFSLNPGGKQNLFLENALAAAVTPTVCTVTVPSSTMSIPSGSQPPVTPAPLPQFVNVGVRSSVVGFWLGFVSLLLVA